ncbi:MAG: hypothetical protein AABM66_01575 [Actinomycetota bacterium]
MIRFAASLPDPGNPTIVPLTGALVSFLAGLAAHLAGRDLDGVKDATFAGWMVGTACGLIVYGITLWVEA